MMLSILIVCCIAYLLGSIPSGLIIGKGLWNVDLREYGSRNIGATNAWRTIGKKAGLMIFSMDFLKGALATYIGISFVYEPIAAVLAGIMVIIGHSCSIFMGFRGGKSVATGLGVISILMPKVTIIVFVTWLLVVFITGFVSLGSIIGSALVPILAFAFGAHIEYIIFGILIAVFIIYRHKANINRLLDGTESKISAGNM